MTTKMKMVFAGETHKAAYLDLCDLLKKYETQGMTDLELIALMANMIGKQLALLDQRQIDSGAAMELVASNLEHGNKEMIEQLMASKGNA